MRSDRSPSPYDVALTLGATTYGYMLAQASRSRPAYQETTPQETAQVPSGEETLTLDDWSGGIGLRRYNTTAEALRTLYYTAGSGVGGGLDASYGPIMLSLKLNDVTVESGKTIRDIIYFAAVGKYYAAVDTKIYESSNGTSWASVYTAASNVLHLEVFEGSNSIDYLIGAQQYGPLVFSANGSTWATDNSGSTRLGTLKWGGFTTDNGATYTDSTVSLSTPAGGDMTINAFDTLANGNWVLLGFDRPWTKASVTMVNANGNVSTLSVHYWSNGSWVAVSGLADGTSVTGKSFNSTGNVTWTRPTSTATPWTRTVVGGSAQTQSLYFVRFTWSAALDAAVSVEEIVPGYQEEAADLSANGKFLWKLADRVRMSWTSDGGPAATWNDSSDNLGTADASVVGLATAMGNTYAKRDRDFCTLDPNGTAVTLLAWPDPDSSTDDRALKSFGQYVYFAHGNQLYEFDALSGGINTIGLDRYFTNESPVGQVRATALVGHGPHLYIAWRDDAGTLGYLGKYGGLRQSTNLDNTIEWTRHDAHFVTHDLGARTITSAAVVTVSSQPWLMVGDTAGVLSYIKLPKGNNPLDANSGCEWNTVGGIAYVPTFVGRDATRKLVVHGATVNGRRLTSSGATRSVAVATKNPNDSSWAAVATFSVANGDRQTLSTAFADYGCDLRLTFVNSASSSTPVLDAFSVHWMQDVSETRRVYELTILAEDYVVDRKGRLTRKTAYDINAELETAAAQTTPFTLIRPDGSTDTVLVRTKTGLITSPQSLDPRHQRRKVISLVLATAS